MYVSSCVHKLISVAVQATNTFVILALGKKGLKVILIIFSNKYMISKSLFY